MKNSRRGDGNSPHLPRMESGDQRDALADAAFQCLGWLRNHLRDIILYTAFVLIWAVVFTLLVR